MFRLITALLLSLVVSVAASAAAGEELAEAAVAGEASGAAPGEAPTAAAPAAGAGQAEERPYLLERIGDAAIAQLYADGFEALDLREKVLIWHLSNAALAGRDIFYDQRYTHGLEMREVLEEILTHTEGVDPEVLEAIHGYTKLFWINNGPFNNLTARKFVPEVSPEAFRAAVHAAAAAGAEFPTRDGETLDALLTRLEPVFFDPDVDPILTNKSPAPARTCCSRAPTTCTTGSRWPTSRASMKSTR